MPKTRNVLIVSEGQAEKKFVKTLLNSFSRIDHRVVVVKSNIYSLYNLYESYDCDYQDIDLASALRKKKGLTEKEKESLNIEFTDTFLIFDFDPQDKEYSQEKLQKLMSHFCDSTESGKLFINYPMLESYKHFSDKALMKRTVDPDFQSLIFDKEDIGKQPGKKSNQNRYKKKVTKEGLKKHPLDKSDWEVLIFNHAKKLSIAIGAPCEEVFSCANSLSFLKMQAQSFELRNNALVLNTSLLMVPQLFLKPQTLLADFLGISESD